jgi:hypothetical protein
MWQAFASQCKRAVTYHQIIDGLIGVLHSFVPQRVLVHLVRLSKRERSAV